MHVLQYSRTAQETFHKFLSGCQGNATTARFSRPPHLDVNLVAQHGGAQDGGFSSALEVLAHLEGPVKGGASLVHIPGIEDLSSVHNNESGRWP